MNVESVLSQQGADSQQDGGEEPAAGPHDLSFISRTQTVGGGELQLQQSALSSLSHK